MKNIIIILSALFFLLPFTLSAQEGEMIPRPTTKTTEKKTWLGVKLAKDVSKTPGAIIAGVIHTSPADRIGMHRGDRIIKFNQTSIQNAAALRAYTQHLQLGSAVPIIFVRNGKKIRSKITLDLLPDPEKMIRMHLIGYHAPKLLLELSNKKRINLKSSKGKITVVDFWATWCTPCLKTDKILQKTRQNFSNTIDIYSVSTEPKSTIENFLKRHDKSGLIVARDINNWSITEWMVSAYPMIVLLDQNNKIVSIMFGVNEAKLLDARIRKLQNP